MKVKYFTNPNLTELKERYESDLDYFRMDESNGVNESRLYHSFNVYLNALEEYIYDLELKIEDNDLEKVFYED